MRRRSLARLTLASVVGAAGVAAGACSNEPDVVALVSDVAVGDAGFRPVDASAVSTAAERDAGCYISDALREAGLYDELLVVAVNCTVPLSWITPGSPGIDPEAQRAILMILLGEAAVPPKTEGQTSDACGKFDGIFYYDDPENPENVILCDAVCTALKDRVDAESARIDCPNAPDDFDGG
jgi:hypothetical protein